MKENKLVQEALIQMKQVEVFHSNNNSNRQGQQ